MAEERFPIKPSREDKLDSYTVPTLDREFAALELRLYEIRYKRKRLAGIFRNQQLEITRLRSWFEQLPDSDRCNLSEATARAPAAIRTLYRHWGKTLKVPSGVSGETGSDVLTAAAVNQDSDGKALAAPPVAASEDRKLGANTDDRALEHQIVPEEDTAVEQMFTHLRKGLSR